VRHCSSGSSAASATNSTTYAPPWWGLADIPRHVTDLEALVNPCLLTEMSFYDVASNICQALRVGGGAGVGGRGLHSHTLEVNLSNSRTPS